ncbi:MAG TPA: response regulator [Deltaproteobacteria bacterium]|nr:response regulator [Deltaproteobacteria bacterium]
MKKVALIDDEASQRVVLRGFLEDAGYEVVAEGGDGSQAVDICTANDPDLVIMDVKMPGMDGIEAARLINSLRPTPVLLLTASSDDETVRRAVEAGVMAYLTKPVRFEELQPAIELALDRHNELEQLRKENVDLKEAIETRKVVERAKGLLMEKEGLTEKEAFGRLRKISMDRRSTMREIAEVIIKALGEL